jgi:hypothetical protein
MFTPQRSDRPMNLGQILLKVPHRRVLETHYLLVSVSGMSMASLQPMGFLSFLGNAKKPKR